MSITVPLGWAKHGHSPPMLPASYGSPAATSPIFPETGSSCCSVSPQMTLEAVWARLLMVSMMLLRYVLGTGGLCLFVCSPGIQLPLCSDSPYRMSHSVLHSQKTRDLPIQDRVT